jgi:hypothetical protein
MKNNLLTAAILVLAYLLPAICEAQAPTQAQLDAIEKIIAPQRQKVLAVLEADKTGQYAQYKSDVENIGKQADPAKVKLLVAALEAKHLTFIRKAYSDAKINNVQVKAEVAKVLGKLRFTMDDFGGIQVDFTTPLVSLPIKFDATLNCPFEVKEESGNGMVLGLCDIRIGDCSTDVESYSVVAGGCRCIADIGNKADLPVGGFSKVTVAGQSDISYLGLAGTLAGYGQVNLKFGVRLRSNTGFDNTAIVKEVLILAPVIWLNIAEGNATDFITQATFSGSFPGGTTLTAQLHAEVFSMAAGLTPCISGTTGHDEIDFIRISASE